MSKTHGCMTVVLLVAVLSSAVAAEAMQRFKWWQSDEVASEIGLTDEQGADIEAIFQSLRPKLRELARRLHREEDELTAIMHAMQAEEWEVALQIDKVEAARGALSKTRTLMLYRMHRTLSADQLEALHAMWERRRSHGKSSSRNPD
jgi:Spy/CpxP family protein refolding chaperone